MGSTCTTLCNEFTECQTQMSMESNKLEHRPQIDEDNQLQRSKSPQAKVIFFDSPKFGETSSTFQRTDSHHKTVIQMKITDNIKVKFQDLLDANQFSSLQRSSKFKRGEKKSYSLIQKSKMGSHIHEEELKLSVSNQLFIGEAKGLPSNKYKIKTKLGDGAYGTVYLAENLITKTIVAMKKIDKSNEDHLTDSEIRDEIEILKKLDHPNIMKILEFYNTEKAYYLITEYCENGELYSQISKTFSETQLAVIFYQLFSGLSYLHENNVVHRDLKLENIMITNIEECDKTKEELFSIKIIDFGTAKIFHQNRTEKTIVGSSYYIAPEVLSQKYNEKCDTWSAGVILYMLLVGKPPFDGETDEEVIEKVRQGKMDKLPSRYKNASKEVKNLINCLIQYDSTKRLSAFEALHHDWFTIANANRLFENIPTDKVIEFLSNLLNYNFTSKFQEMVLAFIVHNMPRPSEAVDIIKLFQLFNTNGDGKLTKDELHSALDRFLGKENMQNFDEIFITLDSGHHGYIQYEEFLRACLNKEDIITEERLLYAFNYLDKDHSGSISVDKIRSYFVGANVSKDVFTNIFNEMDTDHDGNIGYQEFKDMMKDIS